MKKFTRFLAILLITALLIAAFPITGASAETLCVKPGGGDGCYATISEAVTAAATGDTISVASGIYIEHVTINKSLTLVGSEAVINGDGTGIVVLITAPNVSISGFTITGSGLDPNAGAAGVGVMLTTGVHIFENTFTANAVGVALAGAVNNTVEHNQFVSNYIGVANTYQDYSGTRYLATGNVIDSNIITGSMHSGIYGDQDCDGNFLTNNTISDGVGSADGIYLWKSAGNTITGNTITNNPQYGMQMMGSSNAVISGNTITGNLDGIRIRASGYPQEGTPDYHPFYPFNIGENAIESNKQFSIAIDVPLTLESQGSLPIPEVLQDVIDQAPDGATILVPGSTDPYSLPGGFNINIDRLTIILGDGVVVQHESPCFTINADQTRILAEPGAVCIPTNGANGIDVAAGVTGVTVESLEITKGATTTGDGIAFAGAVTDIVLVDNYIHGLDGNGIGFAAEPAGVVDIHGNLFMDNDGSGISSTGVVPAEYNSWGHVDGAAAGDDASSGVVAEPYTHVDLYLDTSANPLGYQVVNGEQFTLAVKAHMVNVNAADFMLTYDPSLLTVHTITPGADFDGLYIGDPAAEQDLVDDAVAGQLHFRGFKLGGVVTGDVTLFTVTFNTLSTGTSLLDFDETTDGFGMPGVGSSSNIYAAALSDGSVKVIALPTLASDDIQGYYLTGEEQGFSVTIDNPATGGNFDGVLVDLKITGADLSDITSLFYWETELDPDDWALWTLTEDGSGNLVGTFGPPVTGFPLVAPLTVTTPFLVTFANGGAYPVELNLRDVASGEILATYSNTAVVYEKPVITSDDLAGPYLVNVPEPVTLTITNPSAIPGPFSLVFDLPAGTSIVYDGVTYTCVTTGCPPIPVTLPLASNSLPFTFTFTVPYTGDISVALFDSDYTPDPRELAELTVATGAYDNYTVTGSFIVEMTGTFMPPGYTGIPVTLTRLDLPSIDPYTAVTYKADFTNFLVSNVMAGSYQITTRQPRVLNISPDCGKILTVNANESLPSITLWRGNAQWNDDIINILDASRVGGQINQTGDLDGDVNFDGKVNVQDLAIVGNHYLWESVIKYDSWTP